MTRLLAACAALAAAVGAARAADPQPLREIDTAAEKLRPLEVRWVGFSPDDKVLVARVEYVPEGKLTRLTSPAPKAGSWRGIPRPARSVSI